MHESMDLFTFMRHCDSLYGEQWNIQTHRPVVRTDVLYQVVTIAEAEQRWHKARRTIEMAIWQDQLHARQSGRTWLIDVRSLTARWGTGTQQRLAAA